MPRSHRTRRIAGAGAAAAVLVLSGCSASGSDSSASAESGGQDITGTVTVFAAASLKESFTTLGERFEKEHPGTEVTFNFGGSDGLAAGIDSGAPADVFAAASARTMKLVTDEGLTAGSPSTFVRNRLEIAAAPGNPHAIDSLEDLTASGLKVVLCDGTVPCGAAARTALTAGGVELEPVSYEQDVKSALTKVRLKEADAALVYRTDVKAAGDKVEGVEFPESAEAVNDYPIARLENAPNPSAAKAFVALVKSAEGQKVLGEAGFLKP
ncbi:molybdate ABC transporter substrate-binding protein [Streptomyces sp. NPDC051740]|uniref:molybdate ABC transporter substrate-binding protein n=1 Tax=Streptomyces sp. NPDC051740 TaxID=3365673 RepID=UPI00379AC9BA